MAEAVDLAKLHGTGPVNEALERCASYGRFADGDLASILAHQQSATVIALPTRAQRTARCSARPAAGRDSDDEHPESDARRRNGRAQRRSAALRDLAATDPLPAKSTRSGGSGVRDDRQAARPTAAARRARPAAAPPADALRSPRGAGGDRDRRRQRWEHAEVLRVLLAEEAAGRDQATISMRRRASGLPAGKTFDAWEPDRLSDPEADPAGAADPRMGQPRRSPGRVRPVRAPFTLPSSSASLVKQSSRGPFDLNPQACPPSADDLDGVQFAALDLMQNGLSRAAEPLRSLIERQVIVRDVWHEP